ncbi:DNA mismatch repair protein [Trifolium repens]|nr:DNA mismatch repair protein [Trifolium repens]
MSSKKSSSSSISSRTRDGLSYSENPPPPTANTSTSQRRSSGSIQIQQVHKLVRTDSLDPAGRLHAYMKVMHGGHLEKNVTLNAVRSSVRQRRSLKDSIELTSVEELLDEINNNYDPGVLLD